MNTTMTNVCSVGIDVSKATLAIACMNSERKTASSSIVNDKKAIRTFMRSLAVSVRDQSVPIVIESTGDFHLLPSVMLHEGGYRVKCINPVISKQLERRDVRGAKTDKIDATRLAKLGIDEQSLRNFSATRKDI